LDWVDAFDWIVLVTLFGWCLSFDGAFVYMVTLFALVTMVFIGAQL